MEIHHDVSDDTELKPNRAGTKGATGSNAVSRQCAAVDVPKFVARTVNQADSALQR